MRQGQRVSPVVVVIARGHFSGVKLPFLAPASLPYLINLWKCSGSKSSFGGEKKRQRIQNPLSLLQSPSLSVPRRRSKEKRKKLRHRQVTVRPRLVILSSTTRTYTRTWTDVHEANANRRANDRNDQSEEKTFYFISIMNILHNNVINLFDGQ